MSELLYTWAGRVPYDTAFAWQQGLAIGRAQEQWPDVLLALEHPPTYTAGRRTLPEHVPTKEALAAQGAVFRAANRGGSVTYHGPGQLVGYPIVHLKPLRNDVHRYLRLLEEAIIRTLADWGVTAGRDVDYTGVWVGAQKIASIGVRVTRGVTMHGFALNIATDLAAFDRIIPCGIAHRTMTSLNALGIKAPDMAIATQTIAQHLAALLGHAHCMGSSPDTLREMVAWI